MIAGTLEIQLAANMARLADDMQKAKTVVGGAMKDIESAVGSAKSILAAFGLTLGVGYFINFLKGTNDAVAHMKELGQEAGTSAEAISRFEAPARTAGLNLDIVAAAMFKMNKAALDAKDPFSKSALALQAIGISTEQLKGLKPDQMFELVARSISKYSDGLGKNNIMQDLFGKSGREMNRVVAEIAAQGTLTATVTEAEADASKKLNAQIVELQMTSEKAWRSVIAEGVPALNAIIKAFIDGKKEGGLLTGVISALSQTFEEISGNTLEDKLADVNKRIEIIRATEEKWFKTPYQREEAAKLNEYLERRKVIEAAIWQQEMEAQTKRQSEIKPQEKKLDFDPKRAELRAKAATMQAQSIIDFNEEVAKGISALDDAEVKRIEGLIALSQKYQDIASAAAAQHIQEGEVIAQGLDTDAQIENKAYEDKLARLNAYFASKEDFTIQDQARLEALQQQHEFNLIGMNAFGIKSRAEIDKMGGEQQLAYYTGTLASITAAGAQHDRKLFELNKVAGIANAIISANIGAAAALKWGWPLGPIFAGIIWAAAAANINAIRSAQFGGGSSAPSIAGGSATPTFPAPGSTGPQQTAPAQPTGPTINVTITGVVTNDVVDQLSQSLKDLFDSDGIIIPANSRQAAVITQGI